MKANNFTSAGHNRINSIFYQIFHRNSYDRFTILLLTFFIFYGIIRLLRGGSPSPVQLSTVIRSRLIQALWLCLVALIELLCWTHWSIRVKILRLLPRSLFSLPRRSRLLHFFAHVITNILPAASYLQAFCFSISLKCPLAPSGYPPKPLKGFPRRSFGYFALPFPFGSLGKASRPLAARAREPSVPCIYKGAPSGYPPKPRKRGPLGGASDTSHCRFPSGASAKRRGRWPLARANPPGLVFINMHLQGIRRNPASGIPSAELRMLCILARTLRVLALADIPKRSTGMTCASFLVHLQGLEPGTH